MLSGLGRYGTAARYYDPLHRLGYMCVGFSSSYSAYSAYSAYFGPIFAYFLPIFCILCFCIFLCIFSAYFLHIFCIYFAHILHIFCIYFAYFLHILHIFCSLCRDYILHIYAKYAPGTCNAADSDVTVASPGPGQRLAARAAAVQPDSEAPDAPAGAGGTARGPASRAGPEPQRPDS